MQKMVITATQKGNRTQRKWEHTNKHGNDLKISVQWNTIRDLSNLPPPNADTGGIK
ncbi:hypothetical protein Dimus_000877, partial [Dionaea muscipula]